MCRKPLFGKTPGRMRFDLCAAFELSNMTCFLCLQPCDAPSSPCGLCQVRCHPACLGQYITKCDAANCAQCGSRLKKESIVEGFRALQEQCETELGPLHEKTLSARLDLAFACGSLGDVDAALGIFDEVQRASETGWLHIACRLERARHLAKSEAPQAVKLAQQVLEYIKLSETIPPTIVQQSLLTLATAHFANGEILEAQRHFADGLRMAIELDAPLEHRLPFFEGCAECAEKTGAATEATFYRQQICRIVENTSNDVCAIATARLEHAISMKRMEAEIPRALRLKLKRSMQALRQRERDPWCSELIQPASAAIYWLGVRRRIRKKSRVEDLLLV